MNVFRHDSERVTRPREERRKGAPPKPPAAGSPTPQKVPKAKNIHDGQAHYKKILKRLAEVEKENKELRGENAHQKKQSQQLFQYVMTLCDTVRDLRKTRNQADACIRDLVQHTIPSLAPERFPDFAKMNCEFFETQEYIGYYKNKGLLGQGYYGEVSLCIHPDTKKPYAIKSIKKSRVYSYQRLQHFQQEIDILRKVHHPNIVGLVECVNTPEKLYMVMEFGGQNLHEWHKANFHGKNMQPRPLRSVFYGMCKAVAHLHEEDICHLDLKPHNVLIKSEVGKAYDVSHKDVCLCDFGFARNANEPITSLCGTNGFFAPEMLTTREGVDGRAADMWSLGCILLILSSAAPGWGSTYRHGLASEPEVFGPAIAKAVKEIHKTKAPGGCNEIGDLLKLMLQMDPKDRVTAKDLLKHRWLKPLVRGDRREEQQVKSSATEPCTPETALEHAEKFFGMRRLRFF